MCIYKHDSEYASGPKYVKILNMAKFWILEGSQYASVTQRSEYGEILNMGGFSICERYTAFWIWRSSEYGRFLNMRALHSVLNMPEYDLPEFWTYHHAEAATRGAL